MENKKLKAAIIGCGNIAKVHAACLESIEYIELISLCDIHLERAENLAKSYRANCYTSYEEMLEKEAVDVIHICTPHYMHVPMSIYCLSKGKYVFLEKPPIMSQQQFFQLVSHPDIDKLGICFQNRYNQGLNWIKDYLKSGKAGKILGARGIVTWSRDADYYKESGWRGELKKEGGGVLINQAIHTLDILVNLMGEPLKVSATKANHHLKGIIEVEDTMEACIKFASGTVVFYATTAHCINSIPLIEVSCENVTIRLEEPRVTLFYRSGQFEVISVEDNEALGKEYWGNGHKACVNTYYEAIKEEQKLPITLTDVKDTMGLMLSMYKSADSQVCEEITVKSMLEI
jgi:Predicted dehydrogenases and related proteins